MNARPWPAAILCAVLGHAGAAGAAKINAGETRAEKVGARKTGAGKAGVGKAGAKRASAGLIGAGIIGAGTAGVGIVVAGLVAAGPAAASEPSVGFNGGCALLGIGAASQPDTSTLRLSAGSNLWLVNHLGVDATVMLDGRGMGTVPARQSTRVTLAAEETATVVMIPSCLVPLVPDAEPLTVTVTGDPPSAPPSAPTSPSTAPDPPASPGQPQPTPVTNTAPPAAPAPRLSPQALSHKGRVPVPGAGPATAASRRAPVAVPPAAPSGTAPRAAAPRLDVPVMPLEDERGFRYSLALIATVLIVGTGMAAIRLLANGRRMGAHRGR